MKPLQCIAEQLTCRYFVVLYVWLKIFHGNIFSGKRERKEMNVENNLAESDKK